MVEKDLTKLAGAACLHGEKIPHLADSLNEIGTLIRNAGDWAETLEEGENFPPAFGVVVYPTGFAPENAAVLREDTCVPFAGDVLAGSERLAEGDSLSDKIAGETYIRVPKVVGGKENVG